MSAALGLYRLQRIDTRIEQVRARLEAIRDLLENDLALAQARERQQAARLEAEQARHVVQDLEAQAEQQRLKLEQSESSLYGGGIRNPKELQELQQEVASLRRTLAALEEKELAAMLASEAAQAALNEAAAFTRAVEEQRAARSGNLGEEKASLEQELSRLQEEREAALHTIPAEQITLYESLRATHRGLAVTRVMDGACEACGAGLTPAQQQAARTAYGLGRCPACGRVLYAG